MSKKLVAYFSASGVTGAVAKDLAEAAGADIYEIRPQIPYTRADLNWQDTNARSTIEMRDKSSRPAMADRDAKVAAYDVIFLGFPIWWYVAPKPSEPSPRSILPSQWRAPTAKPLPPPWWHTSSRNAVST